MASVTSENGNKYRLIEDMEYFTKFWEKKVGEAKIFGGKKYTFRQTIL